MSGTLDTPTPEVARRVATTSTSGPVHPRGFGWRRLQAIAAAVTIGAFVIPMVIEGKVAGFLVAMAAPFVIGLALVLLGGAPFHFLVADILQGVRPWLAASAVVALQVSGATWPSQRREGVIPPAERHQTRCGIASARQHAARVSGTLRCPYSARRPPFRRSGMPDKPRGAPQIKVNRWRRFADWDERPLRLDKFAVEDVPGELDGYESDVLEDRRVPLARLLPGRPGRPTVPPRIVLYRRPLELRADDRDGAECHREGRRSRIGGLRASGRFAVPRRTRRLLPCGWRHRSRRPRRRHLASVLRKLRTRRLRAPRPLRPTWNQKPNRCSGGRRNRIITWAPAPRRCWRRTRPSPSVSAAGPGCRMIGALISW